MTVQAAYCINFLRSQRKRCFSFHYNGSNSSLFINVLKLYQYKTKRSETKPYPFYLENIFKCFAANNTKKKKEREKKND